MQPETAADDPVGLATALVDANSYLTLATVSPEREPWASPVWFAARGIHEFVWASKPGATHSRNLVANPRVSLVVFDSSRPPGEGSALYVDADAALVDEDGFDDAFAVYNARSVAHGLREWNPDRLRDAARHRLYRAVTRSAFVLDDHDERIAVPQPSASDSR